MKKRNDTHRHPWKTVVLLLLLSSASLLADSATSGAFSVGAALGGPPALAGPPNASTSVSTSVTFTWNAAPGALKYDFFLDKNPSASRLQTANIVPAAGSPAVSISAANLDPATVYYWKVIAYGDPACGPASLVSEIWTVRTPAPCSAPPAVALTSPLDNADGLGSSVDLEWTGAAGAGRYRVYFGPVNPPPLYAEGVSQTRSHTTNLRSGARYFWQVEAQALCDPTQTSVSLLRSFSVGGTCIKPAPLSLVSPTANQQLGETTAYLQWTPSANANYYDIYLGTSSRPPLYLTEAVSTQTAVTGLNPGTTYYWKVVARTSCNSAYVAETPVSAFSIAGVCTAPETPQISFSPPSAVGVGQTYVLVWSSIDTGTGGGYFVERSRDQSFAKIIDTQTVVTNFASFVASSAGDYYHRIRAVAGCDPAWQSPNSAPVKVTVIDAKPTVIFTVEPQAAVTRQGEPVSNVTTSITLENLSDQPVQMASNIVMLGAYPQFCSLQHPGNEFPYFTLRPREPRTLTISYFTSDVTMPRSLEAAVLFFDKDRTMKIQPYGFVNLKIGGEDVAAPPQFRTAGEDTAIDYAFFKGNSGDGELIIDVYNPGTAPMEVGAEIGPESWLKPETSWNSVAVPANGRRSIRLHVDRTLALPDSALPRYTFLKLRTKDGSTARLLVQDNDTPKPGSGSRTAMGRGETSFIVPSVVRATSAIGNTFVSRLMLSNSGNVKVNATIYFTPNGKDGFGEDVRSAMVVVPPNDVVNLTDPLVQLFELEPGKFGSLEVRTDQSLAGLLSVTSSVDAPAKTGGTFGFKMPVVKRGDGARIGTPHEIAGITATEDYRTNLILAETTGLDSAEVKVTLYDRNGEALGDRPVTVPRYGMTQISGVVAALNGGTQEAASLEIEVVSGGGSVATVVTVIDNRNDDAVTFSGRAVVNPTAGARTFLNRFSKKPSWANALDSAKVLIPSIVSGYVQQLPATGEPYMFQSLMGFKAPSTQTAVFTLTYYDMGKDADNPEKRTATVEVGPRKTKEYKNVVEELFRVPPGQGSQGPLFVEVTGGGMVYAKVFSSVAGKGSFGDAFPVIPIVSEGMTGGASQKPLEIDGLEQALLEIAPGNWSERVRGTRSNLILNEVLGKPVTVRVSLYEAGNRAVPIGQREWTMKPLEKRQLNTVFSELGLNDALRRKDRTNVKCVIQAVSGEGMVSGVVTTIDNVTADMKNGQVQPAGANGDAPIGF